MEYWLWLRQVSVPGLTLTYLKVNLSYEMVYHSINSILEALQTLILSFPFSCHYFSSFQAIFICLPLETISRLSAIQSKFLPIFLMGIANKICTVWSEILFESTSWQQIVEFSCISIIIIINILNWFNKYSSFLLRPFYFFDLFAPPSQPLSLWFVLQ